MLCSMKRTPRLPDMKLKVMHSCGQFFFMYDLMLSTECSLTFVVTISARVVKSKEKKMISFMCCLAWTAVNCMQKALSDFY